MFKKIQSLFVQKITFPLLFSSFLLSCEQQPYQMGERLYKTHCANCHMDQGEGLGVLIPPLAGSDYLAGNRDKLACMVRYGLKDTIVVNGKTYAEQMIGNEKLNDIQIVNVVNYVLQSWGNNLPPLTFEDAQKGLKNCAQ